MIYYIVFFLLVFMSIINPQKNKYKFLVGICFGLFLCGTYFNGSDWRHYELSYEYANLKNIYKSPYEIGYYIYMFIFKKIGLDFYIFFIGTKLFVFSMFYKLIKEYCDNFYFGLCYFYTSISLYLFIDCPFRNLIAVGISLYAMRYFIEEKYVKYVLLLIFGAFFHKSILVCLSFLVIRKPLLKINKYLLFVIVILLFVILTDQQIVIKLFSYLPFFKKKVGAYIGGIFGAKKGLSLGNIEKIAVLWGIIFSRKIFLKRYFFLYIGAILYFIAYKLGTSFQVLTRLATYVSIFYVIAMLKVIYQIKAYQRFLILFFLIVYQFFVLKKTLNEGYVYLPYTSYLTYIFRDKLPYEKRYEFHYIEFYKRTEKKLKIENIENFKRRIVGE